MKKKKEAQEKYRDPQEQKLFIANKIKDMKSFVEFSLLILIGVRFTNW